MIHYLLYLLTLLCILCDQSIDGQNVTIITDPASTPVDGQPGTFDYPILTSVTLMCMATAVDGSPVTVTSYSWTASNCYTRTGGVQDPCFYYVGNPTGQNITGVNLLTQAAGTVTCTATIDGMDYTSDPLTLRISGVKLTGGTEGTIAGGMGDGTNFPSASNVLDDYTYILLDGSEANDAILFRCATGLGPSGADSNDVIGDMYLNNMLLTDQVCNGFVIAQGTRNVHRFPGLYQARICGTLTTNTEGVYTCTLTNSSMMDQSVSIGAYLSGRTAPVITAMSSSSLSAVDIILGSNIILTCTSSGSPPDKFTWMKDGVPVTHSTDITTVTYTNTMAVFSSSYTISNVSISDNGTYTCIVTNPIGSDHYNFTVTIPQPTATIPAMVSVSEGESITITCTATGAPVPSVNWSRADGSSLTDSRYVISDTSSVMIVNEVYQVTRNLTIVNVVREDIGVEYGCTVTSVVDTVQSNVSITVLFVSIISPEVLDQIQDEGGTASFTCQATGGPVPTISWYFNGAPVDEANMIKYTISETSVNTTTINSRLTMSVESSDVGTYTCNVTNVVSSDTSSGVLTVNVAPTITTPMEGQQFNITEGSNGSITCTATGYPVPTVVWQNSDGSSLSNNRLVSGSPVNMPTGIGNVTSVSVELMAIGAMRVDTGMYRCSANNGISSTTRRFNITVQFAPEIIIPPSNTTVINGSEAMLNCTVVGDPLPSISWFVVSGVNISLLFSIGLMTPFDQQGRINDTVITNTILNSTSIYSSVRLMEATSFIAGDYGCRASNSLGNINRTATLTVYERPGPVQNVTVEDQGSRWAFVTWNVAYNGNNEIMGYIIYIKNVESDSDFRQINTSAGMGKRQTMSSQYTTTNTSYNVTEDILPAMQYQFTVVACDELSCGELGQPSPTVHTDEEHPETPPVNCKATAISSTAIMLTWSPPVMPNGIITNYNISYVPGRSLSTADYSTDGNVSVAIGNNNTVYVVSNLRRATIYYVAIAAHTMVGIGPYSSDNCTVQTMEDVPGGPPLNVSLSSPTSTSINVNWDLPDPLLRNGIITKHQLNYTEVSQPLNWTTVPLDALTSYLIEGLKIFTCYYVSVSAGTQIAGFGPFSQPDVYQTLNDTPSAPRDPQITKIDKTVLQLQWMESERLNGIIEHYRIYYRAGSSTRIKIIDTPDNSTSFTIKGLMPATNYIVYLSAFTGAGEGNFSVSITNLTANTALFQIRLLPIGNCEEWTESDREQKQSDIKEEIILKVLMYCSCEFTSNNIIEDTFSCRGSQEEFGNTVVYRAMIILQVPGTITDANDIVANINQWVQSEPSVIVNGITLALDSGCPAMLDSFDSNDCITEAPSDQTDPSSSSSSSSPISIIIGAGAAAGAIVIIILLLITVVVIIMGYRRCKSSYSVNFTKHEQENTYDYVITKPLTTRDNHQVNKVATMNKTMMVPNPAYDEQYATLNLESKQINTDDIKMESNPAYAEAKFT